MPSKNLVVTITILVAGLTIMRIAAELLVDWPWFSSVAYASVFWTIIGAKAGLLCIVFFTSAFILWANGRLAQRLSAQTGRLATVVSPWEPFGETQYTPAPWLRHIRGSPKPEARRIMSQALP